MTDEITQEQAMDICKWLGTEGVTDGEFSLFWLRSEGFVAIIRRLLANGDSVEFWPSKPGSIGCKVNNNLETFASNENHALQLSILELRGI